VLAYAVFFLLPRSLVHFSPYIGLSFSGASGGSLSRLQDLLLPAAALGVAYPLALKTKLQGPVSAILGLALMAFSLYIFDGGTITLDSQQTTSSGIPVAVSTTLSFTPLLCVLMLPIAVFVAKSCYISYRAMRETPLPDSSAPPPGSPAQG
jgi:hypothetical protein